MKSDRAYTILNVNDDMTTRYIHSRILRQAGYSVVEATNGIEALRWAQQMPDLVLLDVKLPDLNGYQVCRLIKSEAATASIAVLQTSAAFTATSDLARGLEGGADGYLIAPVDPEVLLATVKSLLRLRQAELERRRTAMSWQAIFDALPEPVIVTGKDGRVERKNAAAQALFEPLLGSIIGLPVEEVFVPESADGSATPYANLQSAPQGCTIDGERYMLVSRPVEDGDDGPMGSIYVLYSRQSLLEAQHASP